MKTDRQLIERLLELQEHPEQVTDEQLQQALDDPQMRELVEQMAFAKRAFRSEELQAEEPDVDGEWEKFAAEHYGKDNSVHPSFLKIAASFIGILLVTGIAFAAIHFVQRSGSAPAPSHDGGEKAGALITNNNDTIPSREEAEGAPIVFENVPLDTMLMEMADFYHFHVEFKREEARQLRFHFVWKPSESLDRVLERLSNFEAVNIEKSDTIIIVE